MTAFLFLGGIGSTEILVVLAVGLLIFGGRLPEVARSLGKSFMEFRRGLRGLTDELERDPDPHPTIGTSPRLPSPEYPPPGPATDLTPADESGNTSEADRLRSLAGASADTDAPASGEPPTDVARPIEETVSRGKDIDENHGDPPAPASPTQDSSGDQGTAAPGPVDDGEAGPRTGVPPA